MPVLPLQRRFPDLLRLPPFRPIQRRQLIAPVIQHRPMHAQFFSQFEDAIAVPHALHRLLPKGPWILPNSSFSHLQFLSNASVDTFTVSTLGFTPARNSACATWVTAAFR